MEEALENSKESSQSAHANGMEYNGLNWYTLYISQLTRCKWHPQGLPNDFHKISQYNAFNQFLLGFHILRKLKRWGGGACGRKEGVCTLWLIPSINYFIGS
jgi:hypothetical protein